MIKIILGKFDSWAYALRVARKHFRNWYLVVLCSLFRQPCRAVLRGGGAVVWNARGLLKKIVRYENKWLMAGQTAPLIKHVDGFIVFSLFEFTYRIPFHFFMKRMVWPSSEIAAEYPVDVSGKVVLDIGAYTGDTVLYFLSRGAVKVIAVEPVPEHFEVLKLNTQGLPVVGINAAVGCKAPYLKELIGSGSYGIKEVRSDEIAWLNVPVLRLVELVRKHNPQVVKIDCEGCEYFIIDEIIKLRELGVEQVIVELHDKPGKVHDMLDALKMGLGEPRNMISHKNKTLVVLWDLKLAL
ncbi:MAG: FkbM family methyltransferase [Nitrososphaerota archaeon]